MELLPRTRICFLGDVMLGRLLDQIMPTHVDDKRDFQHAQNLLHHYPGTIERLSKLKYKFPWGDLLSAIQDADVRIINLETSVTTHPIKWPDKAFNYRMHPDNLQILKEANVEYVSLANNHTLDFSVEGLMETIKSLNEKGIEWAGVGSSLMEAEKPAIINVKGVKIAVFSFADHYHYWKATPTSPGINYIDVENHDLSDIEHISELVKLVKETETPDLIVLSIHWGSNYCWEPPIQFRKFAHEIIENCDIDIIHGHSSHHIQGIEIHKGKPILYGCGDFVDDYAVDEEYRNNLGFAYFVDMNIKDRRAEKIELIPSKIECMSVTKKLSQEEQSWVHKRMKQLCNSLGTSVEMEAAKLVVKLKQ